MRNVCSFGVSCIHCKDVKDAQGRHDCCPREGICSYDYIQTPVYVSIVRSKSNSYEDQTSDENCYTGLSDNRTSNFARLMWDETIRFILWWTLCVFFRDRHWCSDGNAWLWRGYFLLCNCRVCIPMNFCPKGFFWFGLFFGFIFDLQQVVEWISHIFCFRLSARLNLNQRYCILRLSKRPFIIRIFQYNSSYMYFVGTRIAIRISWLNPTRVILDFSYVCSRCVDMNLRRCDVQSLIENFEMLIMNIQNLFSAQIQQKENEKNKECKNCDPRHRPICGGNSVEHICKGNERR